MAGAEGFIPALLLLWCDYVPGTWGADKVQGHTITAEELEPYARYVAETLAIEKGANIKAVPQILGHTNCSITIDLYTHLSNEHLRVDVEMGSSLLGEDPAGRQDRDEKETP